MEEYKWFFGSYRSIKENNTIKNNKEYIARKKAKSNSQTHKGIKQKLKGDFLPGGKMFVI